MHSFCPYHKFCLISLSLHHGQCQSMPTLEAAKRRQKGSFGQIFPQTLPTELHPPPSSNWYHEAEVEAEADGISLLIKLDQALSPATVAIPVQYFRWYQFTFGVLLLKSKIGGFIFSICFCTKLIYWVNTSFYHHIFCCFVVCNCVN